ncbi:MAG: exodeoxyribonuclease I [Candidatus Saccharimonas sp.]
MKTFFFYDLETSGLNPRTDRIMQFAGIRTDEQWQQVGEPINVLVALTDDILPSPDALVVTGISPQKTIDEGYSEAQFAKLLMTEVFTPDTTIVGYNNIRFDDEFIRHLLWRNFYDPYEWAWREGRSRWDMLDVVRMTRALRPDGITWPTTPEGKPSNKLERLSAENGIVHTTAHDALSDVEALIGVTKLLQQKQPQLFDYLFSMRHKKAVQQLVNLENKQPFVYTSGRYGGAHHSTTVAFPLTSGKNGNVVVYDLRTDPTPFLGLTETQLASTLHATWEQRQQPDYVAVPVKELQYNRAPAVAPLGVLSKGDGWQRIELDEAVIRRHQTLLLAQPGFAETIRSVYEARPEYAPATDPEAQLYDGFLLDRDKLRVEAVRNASEQALADFHPEFVDERLTPLLLHYKARNFRRCLTEAEQHAWENWREARIAAQLPGFMTALQRLMADTNPGTQFMVQELQLWAESVIPIDA